MSFFWRDVNEVFDEKELVACFLISSKARKTATPKIPRRTSLIMHGLAVTFTDQSNSQIGKQPHRVSVSSRRSVFGSSHRQLSRGRYPFDYTLT